MGTHLLSPLFLFEGHFVTCGIYDEPSLPKGWCEPPHLIVNRVGEGGKKRGMPSVGGRTVFGLM